MGAEGTIGRAVRRREDDRILSGHSEFLDDIRRERVLHMAFVRSPHASARVLGVRGALFSAADISGRAVPARVDAPPGLTVADAPHPLLALDEVRYVGQPVAVVVGETRAQAEDAAERVEVSYEELEPVLDPRAGSELSRWEQRAGDVAGAFAAAAHVVRTDHVIGRLVAAPMETRGALAESADGRLTVWSSSQSAHRPRAQLAQILGVAEELIRVIVPDVGGGFASKGTLPVETPLVALAAVELGRPVKWVEDRRENFLAAPQGRGQRASLELALDADGRILGLRGRILADLGAYLLPSTAIPPHTTAMGLSGCYDIPAVEVIVTGARTHKVPAGPYRGSGRPEATYLIETTIDAAARRLGIDALDLRRRNLVRTFPHRTALGWTYDSGDFERCLDTALALQTRLGASGGLDGGARRAGTASAGLVGVGAAGARAPRDARGGGRGAVRAPVRRAVRGRHGAPRGGRVRRRGRLDADGPRAPHAVRADRGGAARGIDGSRDGADR